MPRLRPGVVSVTFRKLAPQAIVDLAASCGLDGIEWGGDVHVPHGNYDAAQAARRATLDAGLRVACYGSYYRLGHEGDDDVPALEATLATAAELGAPCVRVWAGRHDGTASDDAYAARVIEDAARAVEAARQHGLLVACEWHGGTLTNARAPAAALAQAVPGLFFDWQPSRRADFDTRWAELVSIDRLAHVHVFQWLDHEGQPHAERRPLAEGEGDWRRYLDQAATAPVAPELGTRYAMLEFVGGDDVEQFRRDAQTLRHWLAG